ncbi:MULTISPECIES: type II secretion system F family protein [Methylocaldum]|jgi:general secretion pathway protein F|uniref:type II secretion system F family protein n=1 Tax=unclassified Methylocaldum TaxID=2622260 RepID=UPI00098A2524|nr:MULTISPECIES: type II secretion system F family protein [unclassified Methylocaldum]MBP1148378.1 general secretion pathway protein F [Methylocaldum sp. RMAD-M]MVF22864.1 type II secretion system F family protein [Methylocaldum sp. BRCS4]
MALYVYKAVDRDGETVEAEREAADEATLILALQNEGFLPIRVAPAKSRPFAWLSLKRSKNRISQKQIALFTRELLTLLHAGLPLDRALTVLLELTANEPALNGLIAKVLDSVKGGAQLSDALEAQGGVFSRFYINLIRAGEAGGALELVLERLSDYLERSKELRDTVTTALIYPAILVTMAVLSLLLLLTFVVPQFTEMFESAGKELPVPTQIVIGVAEGLQSYWWVLLMLIAGIASYFRYQFADQERRQVWDARLLNLPLVGDLIRKLEVASFSRTLATLLANGVSMLAALTIVRETLGNRVIVDGVGVAVESLKRGGSLSAPLIESGLFPTLAMQMIKLGEESGHLAEMLERVAVTYDKEIKISVQRMLALLEPVLIVGLGLMIAGIIISILMAILSVNDLAF